VSNISNERSFLLFKQEEKALFGEVKIKNDFFLILKRRRKLDFSIGEKKKKKRCGSGFPLHTFYSFPKVALEKLMRFLYTHTHT